MRASRRFACATLGLILTSCVRVGPDYRRPELPVPRSYSSPAEGGEIAEDWWTLFGDPELDRLVDEALTANQDLAAAAARVEEARALAGVARAERYPAVTAGASGSTAKLSGSTLGLPEGVDVEYDLYRATVALSFELDFWGRLARAHEAARAELLASVEGARTVRLGVIAEVVTAWYELGALERQLEIARATAESRHSSVRLQRLRFEAGTIAELDLAQAEAELAAAEAAVPALERATGQTSNRLAVLLGRLGDVSERGPRVPGGELPRAPAGLPSELLERRPDVAAAEQALIAANARIGVARAALFPAITLTGAGGSESRELGDLLSSGTFVWQAALGLVQPVFQAGKLRRRVEASRARQRQLLAAYAKAVQSAFAEVEDALVARRTLATERAALARQTEALARSRRLAEVRYDAGDASYLEVLDAERNLFFAERALVEAERAEVVSAVTLFKALGGGWQPPASAAGASDEGASRP